MKKLHDWNILLGYNMKSRILLHQKKEIFEDACCFLSIRVIKMSTINENVKQKNGNKL